MLLVEDLSVGHEMCLRTGEDQRGSGGTALTKQDNIFDLWMNSSTLNFDFGHISKPFTFIRLFNSF